MGERIVHCDLAFTPEGWREDVALHLDPAGVVRAVREAAPGAAATRLTGPVVPGMVNIHSHAFQRAMAGRASAPAGSSRHFWSWREAMYAVAARVTPEILEALAGWLYAEMLCAGFTTVAEFHYLHHDPDGAAYEDRGELAARVLAGARAAGMPITLLPVLYDQGGAGGAPVAGPQRRFCNDVDAYARLVERCRRLVAEHPLARLGVAPHSLRAVSPDALRALLETVRAAHEPVHIHVAEQPAEVEACLAHLGARPVAWLLDHAEVDGRWCLVHATHLDAAERGRAAATGALAGVCPSTEADLGDGFFAAEAWLGSEGRLGVGSDSNLRLDPCEELRLLEFSARLRQGRRDVLADERAGAGTRLWRRAAGDAASVVDQPVGAIAEGRRADLVELDPAHPLLEACAPEDLLEVFVLAGGPGMVRSVHVAGERVVGHGRHRSEEALRAAFRRAQAALWGGA